MSPLYLRRALTPQYAMLRIHRPFYTRGLSLIHLTVFDHDILQYRTIRNPRNIAPVFVGAIHVTSIVCAHPYPIIQCHPLHPVN
jgi:hypothetical protein